ncbi:Bacteriophage Mu Gam like protein [compost metagenome]
MSQLAKTFNQFHDMEIEELNEFLVEVLGLSNGIESAEQMNEPEVAGRFKIKNADQVTWALRKLSALKAKRQETEELAKHEMERIEHWKLRKLKGVDQSTSFFEMLLAEYMVERRGVDPKYKGESTPYGRLTFRKQQPAWKYEDEQAIVNFLESHGYGQHVKHVATIENKTEFKKAFKIERNVFVQWEYIEATDSAEISRWDGKIVEFAASVEPAINQTAVEARGMTLICPDITQPEHIMDVETAEIVEKTEFMAVAIVDPNGMIVPGVTIEDKPDAMDVKPE